MTPRTAPTGLLVAVLLGASACANAVEGRPVPLGGSASPALDRTDPCALVDREDVERAVGPLDEEPRRRDLGTARSCEYEVDSQLVVIDIRTNVGLGGVNAAGPVTESTLGGHRVKSWVTESGSCFYAFGVTVSSRVDVAVQAKQGKAQCDLAKRLAEVVEPELP
ncbi:DUF3558 family protein [Actinosynnema sp. NPDC053489]|uniref:DUF3558 family protein n=1 Tax=Actinosynnema sp. NPDC053489 TaxID=3363916 RepID=UPI0037C66A58